MKNYNLSETFAGIIIIISLVLLTVCLFSSLIVAKADSGNQGIIVIGAGQSLYNVSKINASLTIPVFLSSPSASIVTVNYSTKDFEAVAGTDYQQASGTLTFDPGQLQNNITLAITGNDGQLWKLQKRFYLLLSSPTNAKLNDKSNITISIRNPGGYILTFDDSYIDNWYATRALFNKYDVHPTFYVTHWDHLNQSEKGKLKALQGDGDPIGSHTLHHNDAVPYVEQYGLQAYINNEIVPDVQQMTADGFHPNDFAYPGGSMNLTIDNALDSYFDTRRGLAYVVSYGRMVNKTPVYYDWDGNRLIYGVEIGTEHNTSLSNIEAGLDKAKADSEVIILVSHDITPNSTGQDAVTPDKLGSIMEYAQSIGLVPYTTSDLVYSHVKYDNQTPLTTNTPIPANAKPEGVNNNSSLIIVAITAIIIVIGIIAYVILKNKSSR